MGYQVLARKYRPQRFADVAGQDHVTRTLLNALTQNRIAHGYIFSGHRGIGKTTIARILAMALNCREEVGSADRPTPEPCGHCINCREISAASRSDASIFDESHSFDVEEIDAATNRGIDDARLLTSKIQARPTPKSKYRILILDEAHQITDAAWNALLKTLEEPPDWAVFMFATTEPENIPQTIRSRCQHFSFHAVKFDDILAQLRMIAGHEQVTAEDDALALLAEAGDGSMRDALSIMDQAIASAPVESGRPVLAADQIRDLMGSLPNAVFEHLLEAVAAGNSAELMAQLNVRLNAGHSPSSLARQLVRYLRNTLMARLGGEQTELLQISGDERARAARTALLFTEEEITRNLQIVLRTFDDLNYRQEQRFHLELGLLKLIHAQRLIPLEELLSGVSSSSSARPAPSAAPSRAGSALGSASASASAPASVAASSRPTSPAPTRSTASTSESVAPSISPFGPSSGGWSSGPRQSVEPSLTSTQSPVATSVTAIDRPAAVMAAAPEATTSQFSGAAPFPASAGPALGYSNVTSITEGAPAKAPENDSQPGEAPSLEFIRHAVGTALVEGGHVSAAQLLGAANWILDGASLRIEVPGIGKKMLALTVNANTEKLIRQQLQRLGAPARFLIVPGEGTAVAQAPAAPISGSIQEAALSNPIVQRAKELFNAEILSVIDLRQKT